MRERSAMRANREECDVHPPIGSVALPLHCIHQSGCQGERKNRHIRFVLNRSTKFQLKCMNQLGDCQPRAWVVFHGGLERTRSVSRHVTGLGNLIVGVSRPWSIRVTIGRLPLSGGTKRQRDCKAVFATRQRRAIERKTVGEVCRLRHKAPCCPRQEGRHGGRERSTSSSVV